MTLPMMTLTFEMTLCTLSHATIYVLSTKAQLLLLKKPTTQNTEHERPETAKHQVRVQSVQEI